MRNLVYFLFFFSFVSCIWLWSDFICMSAVGEKQQTTYFTICWAHKLKYIFTVSVWRMHVRIFYAYPFALLQPAYVDRFQKATDTNHIHQVNFQRTTHLNNSWMKFKKNPSCFLSAAYTQTKHSTYVNSWSKSRQHAPCIDYNDATQCFLLLLLYFGWND